MSAQPLSSAGGSWHLPAVMTSPGQQPSRGPGARSGPAQVRVVLALVQIPRCSVSPSQHLPYMSALVPCGAQVWRAPPGSPHLGVLSATNPGQHRPPCVVGFCPGPAHLGVCLSRRSILARRSAISERSLCISSHARHSGIGTVVVGLCAVGV